MSAKKQEPKILGTTDYQPDGFKWTRLKKIDWEDETGKKRVWEAAERSTRGKSGVDAVAIIALLDHPSRPLSTVILEQYRPPIGNTVIELPAGLVDEGEKPEEAALRELQEETGYGGEGEGAGKATVEHVSPLLVSDPGLTNANMVLATVRVKLAESDPEPKQKLDEGEHIVKRVVEVSELYNVLQEYNEKGFTVDARLAHWAMGWHMAVRTDKK
ncbi:hypothetical protein NliqN6_3320 [Naganishia liquefaciens]|uniref:Nudix hydrolase domain-containing protein n=1 Tax=Naganishia liquefaciens TaxID=104408 RepID=A0A8H3YF50_9TREE|nr:hypothetical protein NliqN6_3320 [Naganishia liquefaciens]